MITMLSLIKFLSNTSKWDERNKDQLDKFIYTSLWLVAYYYYSLDLCWPNLVSNVFNLKLAIHVQRLRHNKFSKLLSNKNSQRGQCQWNFSTCPLSFIILSSSWILAWLSSKSDWSCCFSCGKQRDSYITRLYIRHSTVQNRTSDIIYT